MGLFVAIVFVTVIFIFIIQSQKKDSNKPDYHYKSKATLADEIYAFKIVYGIESSHGSSEDFEYKKIDSAYLFPKITIDKPTNFFARKKVVFTGDLDNFSERNDIAKLLYNFGADIDSTIGPYTNIIVIGQNPGFSKEVDIEILQRENNGLIVLTEKELLNKIEEVEDLDLNIDFLSLFSGSSFCVTGHFKTLNANGIKMTIHDFGGEVHKTPNLKTDYLIVGHTSVNPKYIEKATNWINTWKTDIKILDEEKFIQLLNDVIST